MKITLGEVGTYINGYAFKPSDWGNSGLPIIRIQNLTNQNTEPNYFDGQYNSKFEVNKGDILIAWSGSLGIHIWQKNKALLNQHIFRVEFNKCDIDKMYFYYAVKYNIHKMLHLTHGATMRHIIKSDFEQIIIPYPRLEAQAKISRVLNYLDQNIINYRNILIKLELLIKSRFDELFLNTHSIETMEIGELFEVGSSKRILQSELTTYGIPFYRVTDLINRINDRPVDIKQYVDELKYMTLIKEKYVPQAGDFLITARGTIGKIYEVKQNDKFYFQDGMITWLKRKNNYINNLFFMELVKTDWFRRQFYSSNNGTTISYLSITDTRHLKVLLPVLNLQLQFAQEVYQINKLKSDVQKSIDEIQLLMDSLMQEYFG